MIEHPCKCSEPPFLRLGTHETAPVGTIPTSTPAPDHRHCVEPCSSTAWVPAASSAIPGSVRLAATGLAVNSDCCCALSIERPQRCADRFIRRGGRAHRQKPPEGRTTPSPFRGEVPVKWQEQLPGGYKMPEYLLPSSSELRLKRNSRVRAHIPRPFDPNACSATRNGAIILFFRDNPRGPPNTSCARRRLPQPTSPAIWRRFP